MHERGVRGRSIESESMGKLPILSFQPILKEYLWGGRRLGTDLGKPLAGGEHYAESWEIVDHGEDQSVVIDGPRAGRILHNLVTHEGEALLGRHHPQRRFPLLFKFLDAQQTLSVQVHPNDAQAARLQPPDLGKTEAWIVLDARPGSVIYGGLRAGVDRSQLEARLREGNCEACLHRFEPKAGDCIFIPAGTVHALGAGLLIAEIQQASNTTFRLFDWNRVDREGKPRALHIDESLATIDYTRGPVAPQVPQPLEEEGGERLVTCDKFVLDRWRIGAPRSFANEGRFHILSVTEGRILLRDEGEERELGRGSTVLVPACCESFVLEAARDGGNEVDEGVILDMYLP